MEMIGNKKAYIDSSFDNEHGDEKKIVDERYAPYNFIYTSFNCK